MRPLRAVRRTPRSEAGFTLVEMLVASAMGVVVLGVAGSLVISAMKAQPAISERAQNISTARWVLERLTRELRSGVAVDPSHATASQVSFRTYIRHAACGSAEPLERGLPAIQCQVTYTCSTTKCTRIEAVPGAFIGTAVTIFEGIDNSSVFSYLPSASEATYVRITLHIQDPEGSGDLTVSDGATLRNATLTN